MRLPLTFPETVLSLNYIDPRGVACENISNNLYRVFKAPEAVSLLVVLPEKRNDSPAMVPCTGFNVGKVKGGVGISGYGRF